MHEIGVRSAERRADRDEDHDGPRGHEPTVDKEPARLEVDRPAATNGVTPQTMFSLSATAGRRRRRQDSSARPERRQQAGRPAGFRDGDDRGGAGARRQGDRGFAERPAVRRPVGMQVRDGGWRGGSAFGLPQNPIERRHGLDRIFSDRGFTGEHHGVGALVHGVRGVGDLGARRPR